jgi:hypothetical protein
MDQIRRIPVSRIHLAVSSAASLALIAFAALHAQQAPIAVGTQVQAAPVNVGPTDIGRNVGMEGVWVIAETRDLPTKFAKMVVTDGFGRYLIPDLPKATYDVWVRGYGLVDSPKVKSEPGKTLNLKPVPAPTAAAAAEYYPGVYWYSMLQIRPPINSQGRACRATASSPL